jgi:hypothetical protein
MDISYGIIMRLLMAMLPILTHDQNSTNKVF